MNRIRSFAPLVLLLLLWSAPLTAQRSKEKRRPRPSTVEHSPRTTPPTDSPPDLPPTPSPPVSWIDTPSPVLQAHADTTLRPFYHGVASGDPLRDRVIIWTRVTPDHHAPVHVAWRVAIDPGMNIVIAQGNVLTGPERDYTVKVDATGLMPGTTYYYSFTAMGRTSAIGRTRTTPRGSVDHLRFAVASCANYQHGYFNAYARIADRTDLDAVLFLGDYFYEDGIDDKEYGPLPSRLHEPRTAVTTLDQYRKRHSFYKLEPNLQRLHRTHPFIAIWDDHEMTDDCFTEGAKEHFEDRDGEWMWRRSAALRAYFEWMPVRERREGDAYRIFRSFRYGDLAEIIMLDGRQEGRAEQITSSSDPDLYDSGRSMLGDNQLQWFMEKLSGSTARWKIVGNQVMMAHIRGVKNLDAWDGYPVERDHILRWIETQRIRNVLFLTGDIHVSIAANLSRSPFDRRMYDPGNGAGSLAVEFVTPSIASANMNELHRLPPRNARTMMAEGLLYLLNRHVMKADLDSHGYIVLDVTPERAQADWFFVETIERPSEREGWWSSWFTRNGWNRLEKGRRPAPEKVGLPAPILLSEKDSIAN